jgi:hypothetical protein
MGHFKEHDDFSKRRGDGDMIFRKKGYQAFVFFFLDGCNFSLKKTMCESKR